MEGEIHTWDNFVDELQKKDDNFLEFTCDHVKKEGLLCDTYKVTTLDGFILGMHRVRKPKLGYGAKPVFL